MLVAHAGQSLAADNRELADRTEQQAASLEQTAASVEELSSAVNNNAQAASVADQRAGEVRQAAEAGTQAMARAVEAVQGKNELDAVVAVHGEEAVADLVAEGESSGATALVLTIDVPFAGRRERDLRFAFTLPQDLPLHLQVLQHRQ